MLPPTFGNPPDASSSAPRDQYLSRYSPQKPTNSRARFAPFPDLAT